MNDLRTAAQQALEALESVDWYLNQLEEIVYSADDAGTHEERAKAQPAITALRAALAQAEPVEPVAWQCREHGDSEWFDCGKESYGINPRRYTYRTLYTAPPQRKPLTVTKLLPRKLPEGNDD